MKKVLLLCASVSLFCVAATAAPIVTATWYLGSFVGSVGAPVTGGNAGGGAINPGAPAWTITLPGDSILKVIDCCASGDRFEVFDFGSPIGITSASGVGGCVTAATCDALAGVGRGDFLLGAGAHSLTMAVFATNGQDGNNFFRIDASAGVPEPGSVFLALTGLAAVAWVRRRTLYS